ncbi:hypothetical protein Ga0100231_005025 [Opitutaceae bacterium TAV4]|nr:hypothetical protein Ga0100231_005025 [Opitutaceae bacterium TAV4]RRK02358.1 hypothetical protein Ga0100230_004170 [Opitutaceae bacterium TAV3]
MYRFILNNNMQPNGDYEVHNVTTGCLHLPNLQNQIDLSFHPNCQSAVAEAKRRYPQLRIDGCYYCCPDCHTS